jgi:hypothetical protein
MIVELKSPPASDTGRNRPPRPTVDWSEQFQEWQAVMPDGVTIIRSTDRTKLEEELDFVASLIEQGLVGDGRQT